MIRITRGEKPGLFESAAVGRFEGALQSHYAEQTQKKRQARFSDKLSTKVLHELRPILMEMQRSKCAYCESRIGVSSRGDIEHYRPKRGARGFAPQAKKSAREAVYHDSHYWWLHMEWDNILLACQLCNRFKATWFPLVDESKRAQPGTYDVDELRNEEPLILNPCLDDPGEHLLFSLDGMIHPRTERGAVTIELLKLDRPELVDGRREAIAQLRQQIQAGGDAVAARLAAIRASHTDDPYQGALRQAILTMAKNPDDGPKVKALTVLEEEEIAQADAEPIEPETIDLHRISLRRIVLHNFRNIADLTIEVPQISVQGTAPWLLLLGENAVGKSTILQAITLTLIGKSALDALEGVDATDVLRYFKEGDEVHTCDEGFVELYTAERSDPYWLRFKKGSASFETNVDDPPTHVLAYGPIRLLPDEGHPSPDSKGRVRVGNLFRATVPLYDINAWLYGLWQRDEGRHETEDTPFNLMVRGLRTMLRMREEETFEPDTNIEKMRVDIGGDSTKLSHLSDGYRTILALSSDLMHVLERSGTSTEEAEGIVLIDEVGSNLHPAWKKRVVSCFRDVFPRIQFIVTTHEPLCLRGMNAGETVLLRRDDDNQVMAITELPNPNDLRVDELLVSEFFGLRSTIESDLEEIYAEYYKLLIRKSLNKAQRRRMDELKQQLREREHLGHGLRDELMYEVIDKLLAERERSAEPQPRTVLKKEVVKEVLAAWRKRGLYGEGG